MFAVCQPRPAVVWRGERLGLCANDIFVTASGASDRAS